VTVLAGAISFYARAGDDNDEGALAGSRADERQQVLSARSRALGWNFTTVTAFAGVTAGVALKATWWWAFLVILALAGFGYLLGLSNYGVAEEDPADDAGPRHPARSPAS
jgi:fatty acid desaturase